LIALEVPPVKTEVRQILQRRLYRKDKYFGGGGRGEVILKCSCICESIGNEGSLNEPIIVSAVASCLEPKFIDRGVALIEAFDKIPLVEILQTMRGLDLFSENSLAHYYSIAIRNKLAKILGPAELPKPPKQAKAKPERKPPKRVREPVRRMAA
jgi:hypothetical protein